MPQHIRRLAVALWLISLVVPTSASPNGGVITGIQVALGGLGGLLFLFPFSLLVGPLHVISLLSNWLVLREIGRQLAKSTIPQSLCNAVVLISVAAVNVFIGKYAKPWHPDLLCYPGFYLWSSSFVLLALAGTYENWSFFAGLLKRSFALVLIAAVVFFFGLVAINFSH